MKREWLAVALGELIRHRKEFVEINNLETHKRCRVQLHDSLRSKVDSLKELHVETQAELDALLPLVLDNAFKGEL